MVDHVMPGAAAMDTPGAFVGAVQRQGQPGQFPGKCHRCGRNGHRRSDCPEKVSTEVVPDIRDGTVKRDQSGNPIECDLCKKVGHIKFGCGKFKRKKGGQATGDGAPVQPAAGNGNGTVANAGAVTLTETDVADLRAMVVAWKALDKGDGN